MSAVHLTAADAKEWIASVSVAANGPVVEGASYRAFPWVIAEAERILGYAVRMTTVREAHRVAIKVHGVLAG